MDWIVVMAGGGGTRLWPLSRRRRPKQFLHLLPGGQTLLGATVGRTLPLCPIERTVVVTAASQVDQVRAALPSLPPENVVVEPEGRNTAPCIGLACVELLRRDPDAVLGVLPSDQHIADGEAYLAALQQAFAAAQHQVVTIGIRPERPETGFGYIEAAPASSEPASRSPSTPTAPRAVVRFVEKPDRPTAERYLASGDYLWNAGMFFFPARRMLSAIRQHVPSLGDLLDAIAADAARTTELYPLAPKISIDYAVMEKLPVTAPGDGGGLVMIAGAFGWNDVGSWDAVPAVRPLDDAGNAVVGEAVTVDAGGNVLVSSGPLVSVVGVSDLVVVATADAVLVLPRERAQDVRAIVDALEKSGRHSYL